MYVCIEQKPGKTHSPFAHTLVLDALLGRRRPLFFLAEFFGRCVVSRLPCRSSLTYVTNSLALSSTQQHSAALSSTHSPSRTTRNENGLCISLDLPLIRYYYHTSSSLPPSNHPIQSNPKHQPIVPSIAPRNAHTRTHPIPFLLTKHPHVSKEKKKNIITACLFQISEGLEKLMRAFHFATLHCFFSLLSLSHSRWKGFLILLSGWRVGGILE